MAQSDLATRVFNKRAFAGTWAVFLLLLEIFVVWPVRNIVLVWWVYGTRAYFHQGIRVLPGKPPRFSNGLLVPRALDVLSGFTAFMVSAGGLSVLLIVALRYYDRRRNRQRAAGR